MNRNESHALANIIQAAIGYIEIGRLDSAIKALMDMQLAVGMHAITWNGNHQEYDLDKGYHLVIEGLPEKALYVEVHHRVGDIEDENPRCFALPCPTAREMAEQILAYCHAVEVRHTILFKKPDRRS